MKLCPKCREEWLKIADENAYVADNWFGKTVPESECEFWAHKELNQLQTDLIRSSNERKGV